MRLFKDGFYSTATFVYEWTESAVLAMEDKKKFVKGTHREH